MKKALIIIAAVIAVIVVAVLVLPFVIPVSVYKDRIIAAVEQATGRSFAIKGPIRLSFLPHTEIDVSDVTLGNPPGTPGTMATLGKLQLRVDPLALLSHRLEIDTFVLVDPVIALSVDKSGRANWQFAEAGKGAPAATGTAGGKQPPTAAIAPVSSGGGGTLTGVHLGDIRLVNGTVSYSDARSATTQRVDAINATLSLPDLQSPMKATGKARWNGKEVDLSLDLAKPGAALSGGASPIDLKLASSPVSFTFKGTMEQRPEMHLAGATTLDIPSIRELAAWTGTKLPATRGGLGPLKISGAFDHRGSKTSFKNAEIALDTMKGKGDFALDTAGARPAIKGSLDIDRLDVTPYLPPETTAAAPSGQPASGAAPAGGGTAAPAPAAAAKAGWSDAPIDVSALRVADADFALTVGGIQYEAIKIGASALTLHLKDGRLATELSKMQLYQGNGKGSLKLDGAGAVPALDAAFTLDKVEAEPLLKDAMDFDRLTGNANADIALSSQGRSQRELVGNLNGKGKLLFADGTIKGIDIGALVHNVKNALLDAGSRSNDSTSFSELSGTFTIAKGILANKDLELKSPLLRVTGAGTVDLPQRTVNYRIEPKLAMTAQGQGGADAAGLTVPVVIDGPWSGLHYRPQLGNLLKQPDKALKQLEGVLKGGAGTQQGGTQQGGTQQGGTQGTAPSAPKPADMLKGLFGGAKN